jgi:methionyl-tRNA synthetase
MPRFYVTTPIYYVNAVPHLGTFYTTVVADALARYHRARAKSRGEDPKASIFFLTGLDEHGQKIERIAKSRGLEPQAYCDQIAGKFQETWRRIGISNDDFIRTTEPRHEAAVAEMWKRLEAAGDIYEDEYDGMYCVGCESAKTEDDVDLENGQKVCKIHRTPVERVKEKNYFFRLPKYADRLLSWYAQTPSPVQPESRRNEVRAFVESGLRPLSVSRQKKSVSWGLPVPGDPGQTIFVWIDALTNYLTVLGGPDAVAAGKGTGAFWPEAHHLIAKDILRFHAVYWPAMLWSTGLEPPKQIFCHGYLTVKGQKISKSMPATKVDPVAIADVFSEPLGPKLAIDPLRYFVLREYTFGNDGDFTYEALFQRYQSDLGNDLGNLLNRTISMVHKYGRLDGLAAPDWRDTTDLAPSQAEIDAIQQPWESFHPSAALDAIWYLLRKANGYIDHMKPWQMPRGTEPERKNLDAMLAACCETLRWTALMVAPAMPNAATEILRQLGREADEGTWPIRWHWPGGKLAAPTPVFPRFDPERQTALIEMLGLSAHDMAAPVNPRSAPAKSTTSLPAEIAYDDFAKMDLRAAKVLSAEKVPKADKLLKLTLDLGGEQRTVVSGIAPTYTPETIVGRTVLYLANLAPRKIRGVESQGMILAAGDAEVLGLAAFDREVPPGTPIR